MACRPTGSGCACAERRTSRVLARILSAIALTCVAADGRAQEKAPRPAQRDGVGSSDRALRDAALTAIPWEALAEEDQPIVRRTSDNASLYRRLPTRLIDCDAEMFTYLVDHPELVVDAWRVMGISQLRVGKIDTARYRVVDAAGAAGVVRVLHRSGGDGSPLLLVAQARGSYDAPPLPQPLTASSLLLLRAEFFTEANGRGYVRADLDSFVRFDRPAATLVAKTLQPLVMKTADHNFVETMRFVSLFSRTAETNPEGMNRLAQRLDRVDPPTRVEFARICYQTADRSARRQAWHRQAPRLQGTGEFSTPIRQAAAQQSLR